MLPQTVVGFSVSDIEYYWQMLSWKGKEGIDFRFADCRLDAEACREDEDYVKARVRERIGGAEKYALLIGEDTWHRHEYVHWEASVAIEQGCTILGINLDGARRIVERKCPPVIMNIGAVFLPFSPRILAYALVNYHQRGQGNWHFQDSVYRQLGYQV
jgi:hypothetical protein